MKKAVALCVMACAGLLFHREVNATTQIHANTCQPNGGAFGSPQTNGYGWYNGATSGTVGLVCGLPTTPGSATKQVKILVYDRNPSLDINCEVFGLDVNGAVVFDSGNVHSSGSGASSQYITMGTPPSSAVFYSATCTIPAMVSGQVSVVSGFTVD